MFIYFIIKVLIEKFNEQSSDVSPTYWHMFLKAIELVLLDLQAGRLGKWG